MGRISKCDKLTESDRLRLIARIGDGIPWRQLESEFKIPYASICEWASRSGHGRTSAKRILVESEMAKPEHISKTKTKSFEGESEKNYKRIEQKAEHRGLMGSLEAAAQEDVRDMRLGLQAARLALNVSALGLKAMIEIGDTDPRSTKLWSECIAINVNTVRKIRGLDDTAAAAHIVIANPRSFD
jgi:hypothetical protein